MPAKHIFFVLFQLSTVERQVFDFLGYMWAPIIANFFQLICVIIGGFGTYQFRSKFITVVRWLSWSCCIVYKNDFNFFFFLKEGLHICKAYCGILNLPVLKLTVSQWISMLWTYCLRISVKCDLLELLFLFLFLIIHTSP